MENIFIYKYVYYLTSLKSVPLQSLLNHVTPLFVCIANCLRIVEAKCFYALIDCHKVSLVLSVNLYVST